jgi:uncharacterized membrane protein
VSSTVTSPVIGPTSGADTARRLESVIARMLTLGTRAAVVLVLIGVVLMLAAGVDPLTAAFGPFSLGAIPGDLLALRPEGFIWTGLLVVMAMPVGRVVVSGFGFLAAGDRRLALISLLVVLVLTASVVAAQGLGG